MLAWPVLVYLAEAYIYKLLYPFRSLGKPESSRILHADMIVAIVATSFLHQHDTYQYACVGSGAAYYAQIFT